MSGPSLNEGSAEAVMVLALEGAVAPVVITGLVIALVVIAVAIGIAIYVKDDGPPPVPAKPTLVATSEPTGGTFTITSPAGEFTLPYNATAAQTHSAVADPAPCTCGHPEFKGIRHGIGLPCRVVEMQGWPL